MIYYLSFLQCFSIYYAKMLEYKRWHGNYKYNHIAPYTTKGGEGSPTDETSCMPRSTCPTQTTPLQPRRQVRRMVAFLPSCNNIRRTHYKISVFFLRIKAPTFCMDANTYMCMHIFLHFVSILVNFSSSGLTAFLLQLPRISTILHIPRRSGWSTLLKRNSTWRQWSNHFRFVHCYKN